MKEIVDRLHESRQIELAKLILESNGYEVKLKEENIDEGIFDNKAKKEKAYDEAIEEVFNASTLRVVQNTISAAETLISDCSDSDKDFREIIKQLETLSKTLANDTKQDPIRVFATLKNLGAKYAMDSTALDDIKDIHAGVRELQKTPKVGYDAARYLVQKVSAKLVQYLNKAIETMKREYD